MSAVAVAYVICALGENYVDYIENPSTSWWRLVMSGLCLVGWCYNLYVLIAGLIKNGRKKQQPAGEA